MAVTTFLVDNANIFFSPGNWEKNSNVWARTNNIGAYIKTVFVGTDCSIELDLAFMGAGGPTPTIAYSVDGGAIQTSAGLTNSTTTVVVATGLSDSAHALQVWLKSHDEFSFSAWNTAGADFVKTTGIKVTGAAPALNAPTLRSKRGNVLGDSITKGENVLGGGYLESQMDPTQTWAQQLGASLDAEIGAVGWTSLGWNHSAFPDVPNFHTVSDAANTSWNLMYQGASRSFTGIDFILVNIGTNDADADATLIRTRVADFLTVARSTLPAGAKIYLMVPFEGYGSGFRRSPITQGFQDYQTGAPDANALLIDVGPEGRLPSSMVDQPDRLHPTQAGHDQLAPFVSSMILNGGYQRVPLASRRRRAIVPRHPRAARGRPAANFFSDQIFAIPLSQIFTQGLDATSTFIASLSKASNYAKSIAATSALTATIARTVLILRTLAVASTFNVALSRLVARFRALAVASTMTASLVVGRAYARTLAVGSPMTAAMTRARGVLLAVTSTFTALLMERAFYFRTLAVTSSFAVAIQRNITKLLAVASTFTAVLVKGRLTLRTLAITSAFVTALTSRLTYARALVVNSAFVAGITKRLFLSQLLAVSSPFTALISQRLLKNVGLAVSSVFGAVLAKVKIFFGIDTRTFTGKTNVAPRFTGLTLVDTRFHGTLDISPMFEGEIEVRPAA